MQIVVHCSVCFVCCVVQWSTCEDFSHLAGEQIIEDPHYTFYEMPSLTQGCPYYSRVEAWNIKGFGPPAVSTPPCAVPSSEYDSITQVEPVVIGTCGANICRALTDMHFSIPLQTGGKWVAWCLGLRVNWNCLTTSSLTWRIPDLPMLLKSKVWGTSVVLVSLIQNSP